MSPQGGPFSDWRGFGLSGPEATTYANVNEPWGQTVGNMIGVSSFALPGFPSGVGREVIGQLPSGF